MNRARRVAWVLAAGLLAAMVIVAGCVGYNVPTNGSVAIYNLGHAPWQVSWPSPGFLGTPLGAGTDTTDMGPCDANLFYFGAGDHAITITSATDKLTFVLHAALDGQPGVRVTYAIDAGGNITPVDPATMPANGTCIP